MLFYMPVRVFTGRGCIAAHGELFQKLGSRCLIVTGAGSAKKCGALDEVLSVLQSAGTEAAIYDGITPNPLLASALEAGRKANAFGAEYIIGIGGGSALDGAKAAAIAAADPDVDEEKFYAKAWGADPLPIVLIGTTAGTGSEVTNVSVVTDSSGRKHSIHDDRLYAAAAFGDPAFMMNIPRSVTLSTGVDVLAHCTESYFSRKANEISRALAVRGIRQAAVPLKKAVGSDALTYDDREKLYEASILGGLAISVTGTCFPHNVGYYFTENYGIPHGFACAMFLPELLQHAAIAAPELSDAFYAAISMTQEETAALVHSTLPEATFTLTEEAVASALPRWDNNSSVKNTIGDVTPEQIRKILNRYIK